MRYNAVYLFIVAFILVTGYLSSTQYSKTQTLQSYRESLITTIQAPEIAVAPELENRSVLGLSVDKGIELIQTYGETGVNALNLLQKTHLVIVEYTETGAVVKSIDGVGTSEQDREKNKHWSFEVNGKTSDLSPDRFVTTDGSTIVWIYK
jgi:hypothetical protein